MLDDSVLEKIRQKFASEVATLRELSTRSSDPLVVAKAIAASDIGVQEAVLARLSGGEHLAEVFALSSAVGSELQVFFRFTPSDEVTHFMDVGILVFVDSFKGEVIGVADPFILQPERRVGRPFIAASAVSASIPTSEATKPLLDREQAFFSKLGLPEIFIGGGGGIHRGPTDTACATDIASTTYQPSGPGGRYAAEDSGRETSSDYCDSIA